MPGQATVETISATTTASQRHVVRWFYIGAAVFVILLHVAGFAPSLLDQSMRNDPPSPLVIIHGLVAVGWLLLFLAQATLVTTGRTSIHRRLGAIVLATTVVMVVLTFLTTIEMVRRGHDLSGDLFRPAAAAGAQVPSVAEVDGGLGAFVAALSFGILVAAGWWHRRRPQIHKRLMLMALLLLASVPLLHLGGHLVGRWPELLWPVRTLPLAANLLLFAGAVHDKIIFGRVHPIFVWVPVAISAVNVFTFAVSVSAPWHQFVQWLAG